MFGQTLTDFPSLQELRCLAELVLQTSGLQNMREAGALGAQIILPKQGCGPTAEMEYTIEEQAQELRPLLQCSP